MFNLIVTLIAIGLGVVITATTVFYGGDSYSEGSTEAIATTYINQAQQVQGGFTLYKAKFGADADSLDDLQTEGYLSSNPKTPAGESWKATTFDGNKYIGTVAKVATSSDEGISPEVCEKINDNGGKLVTCGPVPSATDTTFDFYTMVSFQSGESLTYDEDTTSYAAVIMGPEYELVFE